MNNVLEAEATYGLLYVSEMCHVLINGVAALIVLQDYRVRTHCSIWWHKGGYTLTASLPVDGDDIHEAIDNNMNFIFDLSPDSDGMFSDGSVLPIG